MSAIYYSDFQGRSSSRIIMLGSIYMMLGLLALFFTTASTFLAIMTLGALLICVGSAEIIFGIQGRKRGQLWPHLAYGCLGLICGGLIMLNPIENTLGLTLIVGFLLVAGGLAKVIGAIVERSHGWGWYATSGTISIFLGGFILATFPASTFWTIGAFVAADLIATGSMLVGLGITTKRAKKELVGEMYSTLNPEPKTKERTTEEGLNPHH